MYDGLGRIDRLSFVPLTAWDDLVNVSDRLVEEVHKSNLTGIVDQTRKLQDTLKYVRSFGDGKVP